jgi:hypothetical protein
MNRFVVLSGIASALAMLVILVAWVFTPATPTVTLSARDWMCVESAPHGLTAQCTMYVRAPKNAGAKQ